MYRSSAVSFAALGAVAATSATGTHIREAANAKRLVMVVIEDYSTPVNRRNDTNSVAGQARPESKEWYNPCPIPARSATRVNSNHCSIKLRCDMKQRSERA